MSGVTDADLVFFPLKLPLNLACNIEHNNSVYSEQHNKNTTNCMEKILAVQLKYGELYIEKLGELFSKNSASWIAKIQRVVLWKYDKLYRKNTVSCTTKIQWVVQRKFSELWFKNIVIGTSKYYELYSENTANCIGKIMRTMLQKYCRLDCKNTANCTKKLCQFWQNFKIEIYYMRKLQS